MTFEELFTLSEPEDHVILSEPEDLVTLSEREDLVILSEGDRSAVAGVEGPAVSGRSVVK